MTKKLDKKDHEKRKGDGVQDYVGRRETGSGKGFKLQKRNNEELDEETEIQINKIKNPKKAPEPFPVRMFPCKRYFSDDSSSDYSSSSDSECETIVSVDELVKKKIKEKITTCDEETSEELLSDEKEHGQSTFNKENSSKYEEKQIEFPLNAAPQEDHTPTEPIEERPNLDSDPDTETQAIQLAKFSSNELMSERIVPASSILVQEDPFSVFSSFYLFRLKFGVSESEK
ncbi:hypothetical protein ACET3Z_007030 [Daucus carota]